jgi:hypothetical protein
MNSENWKGDYDGNATPLSGLAIYSTLKIYCNNKNTVYTANDFGNLGTNLKIAAYGATNTIYNVAKTAYQVATDSKIGVGGTIDTWKANQSQQVTTLTRGANEGARETLNNLSEGQDINDMEYLL